jgi:hypothetical protein
MENMIKTTINYSTNSVQSRCLELEMSFLKRPLMGEQGMQVQFQFRDSDTDKTQIFCKGLFDGYSPWSESPCALALRALHTFYTEWFESIPAELTGGQIVSMKIDISYINDCTSTTLTSSSIIRAFGTEESYYMQRSVDGNASWPIQIRGESAAPLGTALKLLAFENSDKVDFSTFPPALKLQVTNLHPGRVVAVADVPAYARAALQAYDNEPNSSANDHQGWIPVSKWNAFLAA